MLGGRLHTRGTQPVDSSPHIASRLLRPGEPIPGAFPALTFHDCRPVEGSALAWKVLSSGRTRELRALSPEGIPSAVAPVIWGVVTRGFPSGPRTPAILACALSLPGPLPCPAHSSPLPHLFPHGQSPPQCGRGCLPAASVHSFQLSDKGSVPLSTLFRSVHFRWYLCFSGPHIHPAWCRGDAMPAAPPHAQVWDMTEAWGGEMLDKPERSMPTALLHSERVQ